MGLTALFLGASALVLSACATRGAYEGLRQGGREACQNKSPESARAACLASLQDDYDSYNEERQHALEVAQRTEAARKLCHDLPEGPDRSECLKRVR
jgi:hypothetical protein